MTKEEAKKLLDSAAWTVSTGGRTEEVSAAMAEAAIAVCAPNVEVKFIVRRTEDALVAMDAFVYLLKEQIDLEATRSTSGPVIEFKNGSCIKIVFEKP